MSETEPRKILLVEDEDNLRELVRGRLEAAGYETAVAEDGYKALKAVREFRPDLIILDLMLPKMDGYTVCRMLRSSSSEEQVPVILFSARSSPDDRQRGMDSGANAYVTKPFDPPQLLNKIAELLDPDYKPEAEEAPVPETPVPVPPPQAPEPTPAPVPEPEPKPPEEPPVSETALTTEEQAARIRPTAPPAGPEPASPASTDKPPEEPPPAGSPVEPRPGGFLARFFGRLFGSRGRK